MNKLFLFMMVSLDGYFEGPNHDLSWHTVDAEFNEYAIEQTNSVGTLLFGHRTYDLMSSYWPTEHARTSDPIVAKQMNTTPKIVFSRTLDQLSDTPHWQNVALRNEINKEEILNLKKNSGKDIGVYGSNNLCVNLMKMGLVDEFRIMVNPAALGAGTPLFAGLEQKLELTLLESRRFQSGNILLFYKPKK